MNQAHLIVLIGSSVLMDSIANCLTDEMPTCTIRFDDFAAYSQANADSIPPDVIIFELEAMPAGNLVQLMLAFSKTQWVVLDSCTSQVSVMSSRRYPTKAMKDLLHVIQDIYPGSGGLKGGKWTEPSKHAHQIKE